MAKSNAVIEGAPSADRNVYLEGEVASGETITPGMILNQSGQNSDGDPIVEPATTVDETDPEVLVALVPDAPPRGSDADLPINHEYDAGENIQMRVFRSGDTIQNLLLAAGTDLTTPANADVTYGDKLGTNDDGTAKQTTTAAAAFAVVDDDVDNSAAATGVWARVYARVI